MLRRLSTLVLVLTRTVPAACELAVHVALNSAYAWPEKGARLVKEQERGREPAACVDLFAAWRRCKMFALARQFSSLVGADGNLEVPDCAGSYNRKTGDYNGYDGGFVVNVRCSLRAAVACLC